MSEPSASRWRGGRLEPIDACEVRPVRVLAADSWLLRDGGAVGLPAHRDRFLASVPPGADADAEPFWDAAIAALPRAGAWFPRLELRAAEPGAKAISGLRSGPGTGARLGRRSSRQDEHHELVLRVRPAPEPRRDVALVTHDGRDPRRTPGVKGPDLERLSAVRTAAQARAADDAVLLSADGLISETATANLAWWRGDVLCVPDPGIPQLAGVTVGALVALATALGLGVRRERAAPAGLDGCEIWALNALHGIRLVTSWAGGPTPTAAPGRAEVWRRRLEALRRPLREAAPG